MGYFWVIAALTAVTLAVTAYGVPPQGIVVVPILVVRGATAENLTGLEVEPIVHRDMNAHILKCVAHKLLGCDSL
jgi:hypothetical protein